MTERQNHISKTVWHAVCWRALNPVTVVLATTFAIWSVLYVMHKAPKH